MGSPGSSWQAAARRGPGVAGIVDKCFPAKAVVDVSKIMSLRGKKYMDYSLLFDGDHLEEVGHLLDPSDLKDAQEVRKDFQIANVKASSSSYSSNTAASSSSASGGARGGGEIRANPDAERRKQLPPDLDARSATPADIKALLPFRKGVSVTRDSRLHFRWVGTYPRDEPPFPLSRAFGRDGDAEAHHAALVEVLQWVWREHTASTEEACPFEW